MFDSDDGAETDLDLGHYERFIDINLKQYRHDYTGKIYSEVLTRERRGEYLGDTVLDFPHNSHMIQEKVMRAAQHSDSDDFNSEIGGTVGDIESLPFLEDIRTMKRDVGSENVLVIHDSLVPYLRAADEMKTQPTLHSVQELRSIGILPHMSVVRTEKPITEEMKKKIALYSDVPENADFETRDAQTLYYIPLALTATKMELIVVDHFGFDVPPADMTDWK